VIVAVERLELRQRLQDGHHLDAEAAREAHRHLDRLEPPEMREFVQHKEHGHAARLVEGLEGARHHEPEIARVSLHELGRQDNVDRRGPVLEPRKIDGALSEVRAHGLGKKPARLRVACRLDARHLVVAAQEAADEARDDGSALGAHARDGDS
jgi:hypothetical protein